MEELEKGKDVATSWLMTVLNTEIYNGQSLADYLTLDALLGLAGNITAAILIVLLGFFISGLLGRRIRRLSERYSRLDDTLFNFLSNIVRYTVLAFTGLFVLNTFGIQTTSLIALIGAAGLAIGLALQGTLSNVAGVEKSHSSRTRWIAVPTSRPNRPPTT